MGIALARIALPQLPNGGHQLEPSEQIAVAHLRQIDLRAEQPLLRGEHVEFGPCCRGTVARPRTAPPPYCGTNPAAFTSSACSFISRAISCCNSSGVLVATSIPLSPSFARSSASNAATVAR